MARFKNEKGLTLIELLITISVLAVVSAIALPVINNVVASSNSNAAVQTQSDVDDFIAKYNASGETLYSAGVFSGYVDTDGDNTIDANELVDTLTIDTGKFSISAAGTSDAVGGSYTAAGVSGATITLASSGASAPVVAPLTLTAGHLGSGSSHNMSGNTLTVTGKSDNTADPSTSFAGTAEGHAALSNLKVGDTITYTGIDALPRVLTVTNIQVVGEWGAEKMWNITFSGDPVAFWYLPMGTSTADSSVTVTFTYN